MGSTPADILESAAGYDDFRDKIISLAGDFPFETEHMLLLGRVIFLRFPDTSDDRNMEHIRMGYRIVRVCILEKILESIDGDHREMVRRMLDDMAIMDIALNDLLKNIGPDGIEKYRRIVSGNLDLVRAAIDGLPRGMIKERFVGGISKFYNLMYILSNAMDHLKTSGNNR